jgi:hypothetical protein
MEVRDVWKIRRYIFDIVVGIAAPIYRRKTSPQPINLTS